MKKPWEDRELLAQMGPKNVALWSEVRREADLRTALDLLMPEWWNGRRIHDWHARPRIVVWDEVAPYIWLH